MNLGKNGGYVKRIMLHLVEMRPAALFTKRLAELLGDAEARTIAAATGIHESTISKWRNGKPPVNPSLENLERLARALKVPLSYLISDEAPTVGHFEAGGEEFSTLPVLVEVAAGVPRFAPDDGEPLRLAFRTSWLQQIVGTVDERHVYRVKGDSMHPTIRDSNVILVQRWYPPSAEDRARGVPWIENGAIYLLQEADGDGQTVKRLALADDHLTVYADNPAFAPYSIDLTERDARTVILGRVRWIGQKEG